MGTTIVCPALFPPAQRAQMSKLAERMSTSLPLPSSPHCDPSTTVTASRARDKIRGGMYTATRLATHRSWLPAMRRRSRSARYLIAVDRKRSALRAATSSSNSVSLAEMAVVAVVEGVIFFALQPPAASWSVGLGRPECPAKEARRKAQWICWNRPSFSRCKHRLRAGTHEIQSAHP